jgi:hypothetical protein
MQFKRFFFILKKKGRHTLIMVDFMAARALAEK